MEVIRTRCVVKHSISSKGRAWGYVKTMLKAKPWEMEAASTGGGRNFKEPIHFNPEDFFGGVLRIELRDLCMIST